MKRTEPGPNQESVWDYPRPPADELVTRHIRVIHNGEIIAETTRAVRILETSHPPVYYIPQDDIRMEYLKPNTGYHTYCEFKGQASYWHLQIGDQTITNVAWSYPQPNPGYAAIQDYLAFYPGKVDACYVDEEQVQPQPGDFYGGWVTSEIVGPFKGGPGTRGW